MLNLMTTQTITLRFLRRYKKFTFVKKFGTETSYRRCFSNETSVELKPWPDFIQERQYLWDKLKKDNDYEIKNKTNIPIKITLPDGKITEGASWSTTPHHIAQSISTELAKNTIVAKVNGEIWDVDRPFERDSTLQLLKFNNSEDARQVFWHSSAHILGEAIERIYGGQLCIGPPIENGFYYDFYTGKPCVKQTDFPIIEDVMKTIANEKQPFERLEIKKNDLLDLFKYNRFKVQLINEKVKTPTTTVYRCGSLIDLCLGPHVRHTGMIKVFKLYNSSSCFWKGDKDRESLDRVYGISFPNSKGLKEWIKNWEEAASRNHKLIGTKQKLFFFHDTSPGSCFFTTDGYVIYENLVNFIKAEQKKRDFLEVITPNVFKTDIWKVSGHWDHYSSDMFSFDSDGEKYALKPMNCPGHCLIYHHSPKHWNELPVRYSEFGVLHRNESLSSLSGLTRVRRFQQDDSHIFCRPDQIKTEIKSLLDYLAVVYNTLGFELNLVLSTRPDDFMGDIELWDNAEDVLQNVLDELGKEWRLNPKDGAFYGPKIDITITDALKRKHQCATIQLDFQLPIKFDLNYITADNKYSRPVIIHSAILGSIERMIAILTESYGGKWPFWLAPRQVFVVPISPAFEEYAQNVEAEINSADIIVNLSPSGSHMKQMIKKAQEEQYNFIVVVGQKEKENNTINVRTRNGKICGEFKVEHFINILQELKTQRIFNWDSAFKKY